MATSAALHTTVAGPTDGTPVLLVGSLGTDVAMWGGLVGLLSEDHHVMAVDLPGHGRSRDTPASRHLSDLSARLPAAIRGAGGRTPRHVVGCSLGAMAAITLAVDRPDVVASLTLACTSAHLGVPRVWLDRATRVRAEGMASVVDRVVERWFPEATRREAPELVAQCRAMLLATDPEAYATYCELLAELDLRASLRRIASPTQVVAGGADAALPLSHAHHLAGAIRGATLHVVDGPGHLAPADAPSEVARLVRDHVERAARAGDPR